MCKSVLAGIILGNIETLRSYQSMKGNNSNVVESISQYVSGVITALPWYFRLPVIILVHIIGLLCLITTGHMLNVLSPRKRSSFLRRVTYIPFFGILNKLVRSMAFLKLFDILPISPDSLSSVNMSNRE